MSDSDERIVIVGGPMAGKSTLAAQLSASRGLPVFCGDPRSKVREVLPGVRYVPDDLDWRQARECVVAWMTMREPWIVEGHATAGAMQRLVELGGPLPDRILFLPRPHPQAYLASHQRALYESVMRSWSEVADQLCGITQVLRIDEPSVNPLAGAFELFRQLEGL